MGSNYKKKKLIYKKPVALKKILLDYDHHFLKTIFAVKDENNFLSLNSVISNNSQLTTFHKNNFESLQILRHSCAHLMYNAVYNLYPSVKASVGPVIKNGFYYDFFYEEKFTMEDLTNIEKEMKRISKKILDIHKIILSKNETINFLK